MMFSGSRSGFRGTSSRVNKANQKGCLNCQKPDHFIADFPEIQKDKAQKGSFQKNNSRSKFKKSMMATWDELDNEEEADENKEEVNLALVASIFSDSESEADSDSDSKDADGVFSKLSRSSLITFCEDLMDRCQQRSRDMRILKKKYVPLKDELKTSQKKTKSIKRDHISQVNIVSDKPLSEHKMDL